MTSPRKTHASLFSGVGMGDKAAEALGYETVATAEIDPWNRALLAKRFPRAHHFPDVKHVTLPALATLCGIQRGTLDLLSGGFPCQDLSAAGTGAGLDGERSGLWAEFARIIREVEPRMVFIENVAVLRSRGLTRLLDDLCVLGYDATWDCIPAAAVGAPHMRDRIWIVATRQDGQDRYADTPDDVLDAERLLGTVGGKTGVLAPGSSRCVLKLPRAGHMTDGYVFEDEPRATMREARKIAEAARPVVPTVTVQDASNNGGPAQLRRNSLPLNAYVKVYPTPTASDGSGGPGTSPKRTGGKNLRTVAAEVEGGGSLNPTWVEWLMGLPEGWTNPEVENADLVPHNGWTAEPTPRTIASAPARRKRLAALGNGLVPQAAAVMLRVGHHQAAGINHVKEG